MSYLQNFKYDLYGDETHPKLVFLHGLLGSGANWRKIIHGFKDQYQILTFDQRGHGRSFAPTSGYSPYDYAQDLKQILAELGWEKIYLVGHSMGGRNALCFAHQYPEALNALVVEDIGPQGDRAGLDRTLNMINSVPVPFESKAEARRYFNEDFPEIIKNHPQKDILGSYFYSNITSKEDGSADWRFYKQGIIESLEHGHLEARWEFVEQLKVPTLFIRGELSDDLPQKQFDRILVSNSIIKGEVVLDTGHWVHFEKPSEFIDLVREFLQKAHS